MQYRINDNSVTSNNNFASLPPDNNNSNRGPTAQNHRDHLPVFEGETIETIKCKQASN